MSTLTFGNDSGFSWAIMSLFAWLVPHISMEIGEYHRALRKSALWSSEVSQEIGRAAIRRGAYAANFVGVGLVAAAACAVALNTKNLDSRMVSIIIGLSRLAGATFLFALSWCFPEWLEVYHIRSRKDVLPVTRSVRALEFNVLWGILGQYFRVYFFLLPFYCGAGPAVIPVAAVVGIVIGAVVDVCVYLGRQHVDGGKVRSIVIAMISVAVIGSGFLFASGCLYINDVWGNKDQRSINTVGVGCLFAWLFFGALVHIVLWRLTKEEMSKMRDLSKSQLPTSVKYKNALGEAITERGPQAVMNSAGKAVAAAQKFTGSATKTDSSEKPLQNENDEEPSAGLVGFAYPPQDNDPGTAQTEMEEVENQLGTNQDPSDDEIADDPTFCFLFKSKCCCFGGSVHCCVGKKTPQSKAASCGRWTVWTILSCFSIYFIVINAGATYQQDVVRGKLPLVRELLYKDMNFIEVCAYDGNGTANSLNEFSNITTFPSKDAAHDAGFLILHCGPCAACSTWPNIKYEYTTRSYLASASAKCGRKSLVGGSQAVLDCLMSPPISWDRACGTCWQVDIQCAKSYCAFNFLQSTMINTMTDFSVGMDQVTAATCEEANCEAFDYPENFVECSGATRRRMNVTSSIPRPKQEECANVDVDWAVLFPGE